MFEITKRLAYEIYERRKWANYKDFNDERANWRQAENMLNRVLSGIEPIEGIRDYVSKEDYEAIEKKIRVVKLPKGF